MSRCHVHGVMIFPVALVLAVPMCHAQATGSITGVVVAQRDDASGDRELVVAVPSISQRSYELGDELSEEFDWGNDMSAEEIQAEIEDGWAGFMDELKTAYPWLEECLPCPEPIVLDGWSRDWSTEKWSWGGKSYDQEGNEVEDD